MDGSLWISETFVNATQGYRFGDSEPYETYADDCGQLFRDMQREYGRCRGRMYIDSAEGIKAVGWVFEKRMRYEDARDNDPERDYYLREVWVAIHDAPDTVTRERHYHAFA